MKLALATLYLILTSVLHSAPVTLTSTDGRSITATVTGMDGGDVLVKRADEKPFRIPLSKLDETSKATVKALAAALPLIDVASVLGKPDTAALELYGKPYLTRATYMVWEKGGWDWSVTLENGASTCVNIASIPEGKSPKTLTEAAVLFGFSKANGWVVGEEFKKGAFLCVFLTHLDKGIYTLKSSPGTPPDTFGGLVFLIPGKW